MFILYRFRVIASLSKVADFNLPHLYLSPPLWVISFEFRRDLWHWNARVHRVALFAWCYV